MTQMPKSPERDHIEGTYYKVGTMPGLWYRNGASYNSYTGLLVSVRNTTKIGLLCLWEIITSKN